MCMCYTIMNDLSIAINNNISLLRVSEYISRMEHRISHTFKIFIRAKRYNVILRYMGMNTYPLKNRTEIYRILCISRTCVGLCEYMCA